MSSGEQHLEPRLRPMAREIGTIGVEQKRPMFTPGVTKRRGVGRDREVTGGDELAAGRGRDGPCTFAITGCGSVWIGSSAPADIEQPLEERHVASHHLARSWPARERGSVASITTRHSLSYERLERRVSSSMSRSSSRCAVRPVEGHAHGRPVLADEHRARRWRSCSWVPKIGHAAGRGGRPRAAIYFGLLTSAYSYGASRYCRSPVGRFETTVTIPSLPAHLALYTGVVIESPSNR